MQHNGACDHESRIEPSHCQSCQGIEGHCRAQIDQGETEGDKRRDADGVKWKSSARFDLEYGKPCFQSNGDFVLTIDT